MGKKIKKTYKPINFNVSFSIEDLRKVEAEEGMIFDTYEGNLFVRSSNGRFHKLDKFKILIGPKIHNIDELKFNIYDKIVLHLIKKYKL